MKKFTAFVLAIAMVLSLATFQIFTTADAAGEPEPPANNVFYGIGASGFNIGIEYKETSKTPHILGSTITYTVTVTNNGSDITEGSRVKVELYQNAKGYLSDRTIFTPGQLVFPSNNSAKFTISNVATNGTLCGKTNPTVTPSASNFTLEYNKGASKTMLMSAGATITFDISYTVQASDIENGYVRNLIVVYLGQSDAEHAAGKYIQTEVFDESENVGSLTVSNTNGGGLKAERYEITLKGENASYSTPSDVTDTGLIFRNGVADVYLETDGSVTGLIPAGEYTITVNNPNDMTISYSVNDGEAVSGKSYSGTIIRGKSENVRFIFSENTADDNYQLTYHINKPDGKLDNKFDKAKFDDFIEKQSNNDFVIKDVCEVFEELITTKNGEKTRNYSIEITEGANEGTYYFCGWSTQKLGTSATYKDITYPVTDFSSNTRGFKNPGTYTIESGITGELYAVWLKNPGLLGYSMSVQGGHFESNSTTKDGQLLGDNGLSGDNAQKFVVHDGGHEYDNNESSPITVTSEEPTLKGYNFVAWFNKSANREYYTLKNGEIDKTKTKIDPNESYLVLPDNEQYNKFFFGNTKNIYSLDALWGRVEGAENFTTTYDGVSHQIITENIKSFIWGGSYSDITDTIKEKGYALPSTAFKAFFGVKETNGERSEIESENLTYTYTVSKDGKDVTEEATIVDGVPQFTEPGVYVYTIKAVIKNVDPTNSKKTDNTVDLEIGTISATLTILPVESLTVTKYVDNGEDPDEEFHFTVTLSGAASNQEYTYRKLDADGEEIASGKINNSVTITLKNEESVVFDNLPDNTSYEVIETDLRDGYKCNFTDNKTSGTITSADNEQRAIFTNTYETGDLTIRKTVTGAGISGGFEFTVTLKDSNGNAFSTDQIFAYTGSKTGSIQSGDTVKLNGGESIVIHDLPLGTQYTVTETSYIDYTTSVENNGTGKAESSTAEGTISTTSGATVAFTNEQNKGGLTITKNVTGGTGVSVNQKFTFTVTQTAPAEKFSGTVHLSGDGTVNFVNGVGTVEVQVNGTSGSVTLEDLPAGTYTVEEQATDLPDNRYEIQTSGSSVTINKGAPKNVSFTNTLKTGSLNVTKKFEKSAKLEGSSATIPDDWNTKPVTFTVTFTLPAGISGFTVSYGGKTKAITDEDNAIEFTLKDPNYTGYTISGIPYGVEYKIEETSVEGDKTGHYVSNFDIDSGTISAASVDITCTNTYHLVSANCGMLAIKKEVVGKITQTEFTFNVTFNGETHSVTVENGGYGTIEIPVGADYTVEEVFGVGQTRPTNIAIRFTDDAEGDGKVDGEKATGTIGREYGNETVIFTNQYLSDLTITKSVVQEKYAIDPAEIFYFNIQFTGAYLSGVNYTGAQKGTVIDGKVEMLPLKNGETVTFHNLPAGTTYTITEITRGDEVQINGTVDNDAKAEGTLLAGSNTVSFTNVYKTVKTGSITINKVVGGTGRQPDAGTTFTVEITLTDGAGKALTGTFGNKTLVDGKAAYDLTNGGSVTLQNVPYGTRYTVTESDNKGADATTITNNGEGTLKSPAVEVTVTNTYNTTYGDLTITKTVTGENAPAGGTFTFTIAAAPGTIKDGTTFEIKGTSDRITFNGDEAKVTVTFTTGSTGSVTIKDLPAGNYTVEEEVPENYSIGSASQTKYVPGDGSVTFNFTNTYNQPTGSLTITKSVSGEGSPSVTGSFTFTVTPVTGTGTLMSANVTAAGGTVVNNGDSYTVTLNNYPTNQAVTLQNLPAGEYTVTEVLGAANELYGTPTVTYTGSAEKATVTKGNQTYVTVTNTVRTGTLTVEKKVAGSNLPADIGTRTFKFTVTLTLPMNVTRATVSCNGEDKIITGSGTIEFTLTKDSIFTITGIPYGTSYNVEETLEGLNEHFFSPSSTTSSDTVNTSNPEPTVTFTNTYSETASDTGKLTLKKVTQGQTDQPKFQFSVTFTYTGTGHQALFEEFAREQGETITAGDTSFTKTYEVDKNTAGLTIINIPVGTSYTVMEVTGGMTGDQKPSDIVAEFEDNEPGDTVTGENTATTATGKIDADKDSDTVIFYNRYLVDIVISKELAGDGHDKPDRDEEFEFTIKFDGFNTADLNQLQSVMRIVDAHGERKFADLIEDFRADDAVTVYVTANTPATVYQVPAGRSHYTITETDSKKADKVEVSIGGGAFTESTTTGKQTVHNSTAQVTFKNTYNKAYGGLTIGKTVNGLGADTGKEFTFTVTLEGDDIAGQTFHYTGSKNGSFTGKTLTVTLSDGQSVTILDLPHGTSYTVSETSDGEYTASVTAGESSGYIEGDTIKTVTFTNTRKTGSLTIEKSVTGGENVRVRDTFSFTVTAPVKFTGTVSGFAFVDGVATVEVRVNGGSGSVTLEGLPTGTYTVTEVNAPEIYTALSSGTSVEVREGDPAKVTVTNEIGTGSLTVGKSVTANNPTAPAPDDASFTVTVTFSVPNEIESFDVTCGGEKKTVTNNTTLKFTLQDGGSFTIENIPYGVEYAIGEELAPEQQGHYEVTYSNGRGRVIPNRGEINDANDSPSVTVNNKYFAMLEDTGSLWIVKRVQGTFPSAPESYTFEVTFGQGKATAVDFNAFLAGLGAGVSGSTYTFTLKNGENKVIFDIPEGVTYTVKEVFGASAVKPTVTIDADRNDVTTKTDNAAFTATGAIDESRDQDGFTFTNKYLADLTVTKEVERSPYAADTRDTFDFTVHFFGADLSDFEIRYSIPGGAEGAVGKDGTLTFSLKAGQTVTFKGIPAGTQYTVTEDAGTRGETVKVNGAEARNGSFTGTVDVDSAKNRVTFTNIYTTLKTGTIRVTKDVIGTGRRPGAETVFDIKITLTDANDRPLSGTFGGVTFNVNGVGSCSLKAGESLELKNVPLGTKYKIEETNSQGADRVDITLNGEGQLISSIAAVSVINTYTKTYGDLTISKSVTGGGAETDVDFTFTVTLTGDGTQGKRFKYDGSKEGEIVSGGTVTLRHGQSITIHDLPDGTQYTVAETANGKYDTPDEMTGAVVGNAAKTAAFTNTRKTGSLTIEKKVTGGAGVKVKETFTFIITPANGTRMAYEGVTGATANHAGYYTATVTLDGTSSGTVTVTGLPTGDYTVEEQTAGLGGLYKTLDAPANVTVSDSPAAVTVTNEIQTGGLDVTKKFELSENLKSHPEMASVGWNEKDVTFTVTFTLPDHIQEFTVTHGENTETINSSHDSIEFTLTNPNYSGYSITGIPYGVKYEITETAVGSDSDYYVDTYENGGGTVSTSSTQVTCTNTYHLVQRNHGALIIRKDVVGETGQTDFTFEVTYGTTTDQVIVKSGSYALVEVPIGTTYTVRETTNSAYTAPTKTLILPGSDLETGDAESGDRTFTGRIDKEYDSDSVHYVNMYLADLTITKEVEVDKYAQGPDAGQEFSFYIDFSGSTNYVGLVVTYSVNGGDVKSIDKPGTLELKLKAGETVTFYGIPVGASHTITENAATRGESVEITASSGDVDNDNVSTTGKIVSGGVNITFTNKYTTPKTGSITIGKKVAGAGRRPEAGTRYTVTVELTDGDGNALTGTFGGQDPDASGLWTFELADGESVLLENVPYGTHYAVKETDSHGADDVAVTDGGEGILESPAAAVTVTNTFNTTYGDLTVTKEVAGAGADTEKSFTFTVTLTDASGRKLAGEFSYSGSASGTITDGELTVTLGHGDRIVIHDLPGGTRYTVTEKTDAADYATTYSVNGAAAVEGAAAKGAINAGGDPVRVAFTNTRRSGKLTIEKSVTNGLTVNRTFTFTVRSSVSFSGRVKLSTGGYVTFNDGEARGVTVTVNGSSGSVTLEGLPTGTYTVTETDSGAFTPGYAGSPSAAVTDGGTATVTVTNTIATGTLTVTKKVTANNPDPLAQAPAGAKYKVTVTFTLPADIKSFEAAFNGTRQTVKNGETLTLTLENGDTQTVAGIPYGAHYEVSETFDDPAEKAQYEVTYTGSSSGNVGAANTAPSVTVNNKYFALKAGTGSLWIFKEVHGSSTAMPGSYTFQVEFERGTANADEFQAFLEALGVSGTEPYAFTLGANERKILMDIPEGVQYTVSEVFDASVVKPANVIVTASDSESAQVTNGTAGTDGTLSTPTAKGTIDASLNRDVDGFTFYNQYLANLTLELIPDDHVPDGTEFEFVLKFSGLQAEQVSSIMKIDDANGTRGREELEPDFIEDDAVTITLRKDSKARSESALVATIYNVPIGVSHYVFTATGDNLGDIVTWDVSTDKVEDPQHSGTDTGSQTFSEERDYVTFKNAYHGGWLTIVKELAGNNIPSADREYTFTVTREGETVAAVTITGEGRKTIPLPAGEYTVTESGAGGSTSTTVRVDENGEITGTGAGFTLTENGSVTVTFTNTYTANNNSNPGSNWTPPELDTSNHFSFIVGYPDGTVRPDGSITRAEAASILFRLLTDSARETYKATVNTFSDVNEGAWYNLAVSTLQKMEIIHGYEDGTFRPDRPITRAEMATIVAQFYLRAGAGATGNSRYYEDVGADDWYSFFVELVTDKGIMVGVGEGSFEPYRPLTRAEAMAVFNRILGRTPDAHSFDDVVKDVDYVTWPDNMDTGLWYYADVQEATNSHDYVLESDGKERWTDAKGMKQWEG